MEGPKPTLNYLLNNKVVFAAFIKLVKTFNYNESGNTSRQLFPYLVSITRNVPENRKCYPVCHACPIKP